MYLLPSRPFAVVLAGLLFGGVLFTSCDSTGPSSENSEVEIGFASSSSSAKSSGVAAKATPDSLVLDGSNGTLRVSDIRLIVSEFELDGEADSAEFETEKPAFLDLPLDSADVAPVAADVVPPGTYNEFEFEIEDVDLDDDDDEEELQNLRDEIDEEGFSDWPNDASMVVVGTFTSDGETRSFTTYFDAEIEVDIEMDRPLEIGGDAQSRRLTVNLDPTRWFTNSDGSVVDLSQDDFSENGDLVEFEYEFEDGVTEIEFDD